MLGIDWVHLFIVIIIVAACAAILFVLLRVFGITIPAWLVQIFWIVVAAVVGILAIKFVAGLW